MELSATNESQQLIFINAKIETFHPIFLFLCIGSISGCWTNHSRLTTTANNTVNHKQSYNQRVFQVTMKMLDMQKKKITPKIENLRADIEAVL